jgi:hypothetical protein
MNLFAGILTRAFLVLSSESFRKSIDLQPQLFVLLAHVDVVATDVAHLLIQVIEVLRERQLLVQEDLQIDVVFACRLIEHLEHTPSTPNEVTGQQYELFAAFCQLDLFFGTIDSDPADLLA